MSAASDPAASPASRAVPVDEPIDRLNGRLRQLDAGIQRSVRRSRRISWFAWGFLFAAGGEYLVPILADVYGYAGSGFMSFPGWALVGLAPAVVLVTLAIRELWIGSGEAVRFSAGERVFPETAGAAADLAGVSFRALQEDQKRISSVRGELEVSMIPLVLGGFGALEIPTALVLEYVLGSNLPSGGEFYLLLFPLLPLLVVGLVVWLLWSLAKLWVAQYQTGLDDQVLRMISFEGEFFGRFAGPPAGS